MYDNLRKWKILEFYKLLIFGIHHIGNFWDICKIAIFEIFEIKIFCNFTNWKFFEFHKLEIFGIYHIGKFRNLTN